MLHSSDFSWLKLFDSVTQLYTQWVAETPSDSIGFQSECYEKHTKHLKRERALRLTV